MNLSCFGFLLMLMLPPTLLAQDRWERVVSTGKGISIRSSEPHELSYWTADPIGRDEGGGLVSGDGYEQLSETTDLGTAGGYRIVQVLNRVVAKEPSPDAPDFTNPPDYRKTTEYKMLLVQVGPDEYREIYHLENEFGRMRPLESARIAMVGTESILSTVDPDGGNGGFCVEGYWRFDESGPNRLNFDAVEPAIRSAVPEDTRFNASCFAIDLERQEINAAVQRADAECSACGWLGNAKVRFVLRGSIVEPTEVRFDPNSR